MGFMINKFSMNSQDGTYRPNRVVSRINTQSYTVVSSFKDGSDALK